MTTVIQSVVAIQFVHQNLNQFVDLMVKHTLTSASYGLRLAKLEKVYASCIMANVDLVMDQIHVNRLNVQCIKNVTLIGTELQLASVPLLVH